MNIVPFAQGDAIGTKREAAVLHARAEIENHEGIRKQLFELQAGIGSLPEVDLPLQHVFAPGACARTIRIPAGTVVVGKIHKHQHLNILSQGDVSVMTEQGGLEHLSGPLTMVSQPGTKRALYAHTDVVWTVVHLTNETDIEKIEEEVIAKTYEEYEQFTRAALKHSVR